MDERDGDRMRERPFGEDLTPAIRRTDAENRSDASAADIDELIGPPQTLESEIQGVWAIQSAVSAAILGVIAAVAFSVLSVGGPWVGGVLFVVGTIVGIALTILRYRIWTYQVRSDSLYLRRGVVTRVNTVAPYIRIQHVDTRRGPVERVFGLATTVVYTAGSRGADVSIPGLTPERAADLQARLKQLAIAAEGEDAV
jgi:membrane protein YdbS with pleckstrin-like domain